MGFKVRLIKGSPMTIGEKKLKPVVRVISWHRRRAAIRQDDISGFGAVALWLQPVAVLEEMAGGHRRIPVRDETSRSLLALLVAALVVPLALNLLVHLIRLVKK